MRTMSYQLIAVIALLLCTGCQTCLDSFNRFEAYKTEKCCSLFHCHKSAPPAVIYAPIVPVVQQPCPQPVAVAAAPCAQPAPICAPIQCDPCSTSAGQVSAATCCPQPCCPPVCCVNECCPSDSSSSYGTVSYGASSGCDSCGGGTIVTESPTYSEGTSTFQNNQSPQVAPGPAPIGG